MTNEETIKFFAGCKYHCDNEEPINIAIAAIEKQIPKKPDLEGDGYADGAMVYDTWHCPRCDTAYEVDIEDFDYCPHCGQKICWGEDEDDN